MLDSFCQYVLSLSKIVLPEKDISFISITTRKEKYFLRTIEVLSSR